MASVQWLSTLGVLRPGDAPHGLVTLDTAGNVDVTITGATAMTQYDVSFFTYGTFQTITVGTLMTDASGNAKTSMKFPNSGNWAGGFRVTHTSEDGFSTAGTGWAKTSAILLGVSTVSNVCVSVFCSGAQDPGAGTLTTADGKVQILLTGASANAIYEVTQCTFGGSSCYGEGNLITDASGNGMFNGNVEPGVPSQVWRLQRVSGQPPSIQGVGFVSAFRIP